MRITAGRLEVIFHTTSGVYNQNMNLENIHRDLAAIGGEPKFGCSAMEL